MQLLGEVLVDGERGNDHRCDPGELQQVRGHDGVGCDARWLAEAHVDCDAFELASRELGADGPALATAGQIVVGGGALHGEREEIVHFVGCGVQQQLDRLLLPERPVDVDVLGRSCLPAEPQLERETAFEKPALSATACRRARSRSKTTRFRSLETPTPSDCSSFKRVSKAVRNALADAYFTRSPS